MARAVLHQALKEEHTLLVVGLRINIAQTPDHTLVEPIQRAVVHRICKGGLLNVYFVDVQQLPDRLVNNETFKPTEGSGCAKVDIQADCLLADFCGIYMYEPLDEHSLSDADVSQEDDGPAGSRSREHVLC